MPPFLSSLRKTISLSITLIASISLIGCQKKLSDEALDALYQPPPPLNKPLAVFHVGHSLVGPHMPFMLQQLAPDGHRYNSQLGWGTALKAHWEPSVEIKGLEQEKQQDYYRDLDEAIASQEYQAFVLTEMVEIKDAIKYFDSEKYLANFADKIHQNNPDTRLYFYESWHEVNDPAGWINRLKNDYPQYWQGKILHPALAKLKGRVPIYMIPVGQVFAKFFKEVERLGGLEGMTQPEDIFNRKEDGTLDVIHINDIGSYFVAIVHYSVLYQRSPEGLPYQLKAYGGKEAMAPSAEAATLFQKITWEVVSAMNETGVGGRRMEISPRAENCLHSFHVALCERKESFTFGEHRLSKNILDPLR